LQCIYHKPEVHACQQKQGLIYHIISTPSLLFCFIGIVDLKMKIMSFQTLKVNGSVHYCDGYPSEMASQTRTNIGLDWIVCNWLDGCAFLLVDLMLVTGCEI